MPCHHWAMPSGIVDPEPWIQSSLDQELAPLRKELAAARGRIDRFRIRRKLVAAERRIRRLMGGTGPVSW
jgi:hypothetical protein